MEIIFNYTDGAGVEILDKNDPYALNEYTVIILYWKSKKFNIKINYSSKN